MDLSSHKHADLPARGSELNISFFLFLGLFAGPLFFFSLFLPTRPPPHRPPENADQTADYRISSAEGLMPCRFHDSAILLAGNPPPRARAASPTR